jgi:hypothetical protein
MVRGTIPTGIVMNLNFEWFGHYHTTGNVINMNINRCWNFHCGIVLSKSNSLRDKKSLKWKMYEKNDVAKSSSVQDDSAMGLRGDM